MKPGGVNCVAQPFLRVTLVCVALFSASTAVLAQDYNPSIAPVSEEAGDQPNRALDNAVGEETVDPFTGALKLVVTDLVIPSNGGLDLKVVRNYQSFGLVQGVQVPVRSYQAGRTATGIGWDLHFGRLWRGGSGSTAPQLPATDALNGCRIYNPDSSLNPVLELPDGHRELFAAASTTTGPYAYISPGRWILKCLPTALNTYGDGGAIAVSPEGVQYIFNFFHRVSNVPTNGSITQTESNYAFHVTKILHPNGSYITISYLSKSGSYYTSLSSATHSEGQSVTFSYYNVTDMSTAHLASFSQALPAAEGGTRTWTLNYVGAVVPSDSEYLHSVTRPDGRSTLYGYYTKTVPTNPNPDGVFSVETITTPLGGIVNYSYVQQTFPTRDANDNPQPYYVVSKKTVQRLVNGPTGTWTYTYQPAPANSATQDFATVIGPVSCTIYAHYTSQQAGDNIWQIGLLASKATGNGGGTTCTPLRTETYTWINTNQTISTQQAFRPTMFHDSATFAPFLNKLSISQDGTTYTTAYNTPDPYGNPAQIVESGWMPSSSGTPVAATRTTNLTYFIDTTTWIIHRKQNETIVGAGQTTGGASTDHAITRQFFTTAPKIGLLQQESVAGVTTQYDYYTDATETGEVSIVTDANTYPTNFSSYKRGVAQVVSRSIDGTTTNVKTIHKSVGDSGMLLSTDDAAGNTTGYSYDLLNRLASITTARTDDDNITITRSSNPSITTDTIARGPYQEVRQFDGFGALTRTDWTDTGNGTTMFRKTDYDFEGRISKAYLPNSTTSGDDYQYDGLGRVLKVTHADGTLISYVYQASNITRVRDERGFDTYQHYRSFGEPASRDLMYVEAPLGDTPGSGGSQTTYLSRNLLGQVNSIVQGGVTRSYNYDTSFRLVGENYPEVGSVVYGIDAMGHITSRTVGSSGITQYVLDHLYRLSQILYPDSSTNVSFTYYNNDLVQTAGKAGSQWSYIYDANHNLSSETLTLATPTYPMARTYLVSYGYDALDGRQSITYPGGLQVNYAPNAFGQATAATASVSGGAITGFVSSASYYPNGQLNSLAFPNGVTTTYGQDNRLRLTTFASSVVQNGVTQTLVNRVYGYDGADDVTSITDNSTPANSKTLTYDGLRRLRTANGGWGSGSVSYYPNNNINTKAFGSSSLTFNYDSTNRLQSITGPTPMSFSYDVYGNEIATGRSTYGNYAFDDDSLLKTVSNSNGTAVIQYAYDANRRVTQEAYVSGTSTKYKVYGKSGLLLFEENLATPNTTAYVYMGTRLVASRVVGGQLGFNPAILVPIIQLLLN